jgi:exopolysaccharide production protein ExoF
LQWSVGIGLSLLANLPAMAGGEFASRADDKSAETRPVFVAGDVRRPGPFPYQKGMTVQHAIAAAGGLRAVDLETLPVYFELGRLREKLRQSQESLGLLMIRRARLLAERDDKRDFELPSGVQSVLGADKATRAYESERALLKQRAESQHSQADMLERQIGLFKEEIAALEGQSASKEKEGELVTEERQRVESLMQRGLTPNSGRSIELQRIVVQIEGERRALATNIVKARQEIARVEQAIANLANQRQLEVTGLLKETDDTIGNLTVAVEETRISLAQAQEVLPIGSTSPTGASQAKFIVRRGGDQNLTIAAGPDTPLLPGDVVDVPRR